MRDRHRHRRLAEVLALIALLPLLVAAGELDHATQQREALQAETDRAVAAYEDAVARLAVATDELDSLARRTEELEREAAEVADMMAERARATFQRGDAAFLSTLLSARGVQGAIERAELLAALTARDRGRLEGARTLRVRLEQSRALLVQKRAELQALEGQLAQRRGEVEERLRRAQAQERELRDRRDRQRAIRRGVQQGTYACVMARPYHFRDTWGAPRSGGRSHRGTDVMGMWRAEVYAFTHGRIARIGRSGLGGLGVYLRGDDGNVYYYAHLHSIADGIYAGRRVEAGQLVAYNGASGNAHRSAPHVHFELHPGGGRGINPYVWLAAACL